MLNLFVFAWKTYITFSHHYLIEAVESLAMNMKGVKSLTQDDEGRFIAACVLIFIYQMKMHIFSSHITLSCIVYVLLGVPRETEEERKFGDFPVFGGPDEDAPFSTFKLSYSEQEFDRLAGLMRFNTLNNIDTIKEAILDATHRRNSDELKMRRNGHL